MSNTNINDVVLKNFDKFIESKLLPFKTPDNNNKKLTTLELYNKIIESDEFKNQPTKEKILDEDEYINNLEEIISRDYFPDLYKINQIKKEQNLKSEAEIPSLQNTYMENLHKINEEYEKNIRQSDEINEPSQKITLDKYNLDSYLLNHTTDEQESLKNIIQEDKKKRLKQLFWMYEQEYNQNLRLKELEKYNEEFLKLPYNEKKLFEKAALSSNPANAKNNMFFLPDSKSIYNIIDLKGKDNAQLIKFDELSKNIILEKEIVKDNTRLPKEFIDNMINITSNQIKKKLFESYESSDVIKLLKELKNLDETKVTPLINGYKLIKDPEPIEEKDPIPLITWGELIKTSNILESKKKKFSIPHFSDREKIAHNLANKNSGNGGTNTNNNIFKQPTEKVNHIKTVNSRRIDLTPGAIKLLNSVRRDSTNIFDEPSKKRNTPFIHDSKTNLLGTKRSLTSLSIVSSIKRKKEEL